MIISHMIALSLTNVVGQASRLSTTWTAGTAVLPGFNYTPNSKLRTETCPYFSFAIYKVSCYYFYMSEKLFFLISFLMSFAFFTALAFHVTSLMEALIIGLLITALGGVLASCIVLALIVLLYDYLKWIAAAVYCRLHPSKS